MRLVTLHHNETETSTFYIMSKQFKVTGTTQDFIAKFDAIAKALADEGKISYDRRTKDKGSRTEAFAYCVEMLHEQFIGRKEATAEKKRNASVNAERARQANAKVEETKEGIKKLCAISAKVDKKHKFYITPNFIKKQLGLSHARVAKKALQDEAVAKLVEETNKKQLGFPSFLHGEPSPKSSQFELYQDAKSHNLRFRSKAFKTNEKGQLLFIADQL